jgi:hypothetical protein
MPFADWAADQTYGRVRPEVICPHCQKSGHVRMKQQKMKKGVSGGKATGALLTGGVSLLATGLSRKGWVTKAFCQNCQTSWTIE